MAKVRNLDELSPTEIDAIKIKIAAVLSIHSGAAPSRSLGLLPISHYQGKLYEAHVLVSVLKKLKNEEKLDIEFMNGTKVRFRHKGAWINRTYPYFKLIRFGKMFGELFVDQYFSSMSHKLRVSGCIFYPGDFHELDIALIKPSVAKFPNFEDVILGIECKNTGLQKSVIRELLGFRRELSLLSKPKSTLFRHWPATHVPASPSSVHMLYCSDPIVKRYAENCAVYGTILKLHRIR